MTGRPVLTATVLLTILLPTLPALAQEPPPEPAPPPPFATVNTDSISRDDFIATLKAYWGSDALRMLIDERLVAQEAARLGIRVSEDEVTDRLKAVRAGYPDTRSYEAHLHERGISENALRRELKTKVLLEKIVDQKASITDEDVAGYYEEHKAEFTRPARVELDVITTDTIESSYLAGERIANEEFGTVAAEMSVDEHAADGGFWGELTAGEIQPEAVQVAAMNLEPGAHSEPIEVDGKFYIIWAKDKTPGSEVTLEGAAPAIREQLRRENGVTADGVMASLRNAADVKVNAGGYTHVVEGLKQQRDLRVEVDGEMLELDPPPVIRNRMLVSVEPLAEAMGAEYRYWPDDRKMTVTRDDLQLVMGVGRTDAGVGEVGTKPAWRNLDQPPVIIEGTVYVPVRFVVDELGGSLVYIPGDALLKIASVKEPDIPMEGP